MATYFLILLLLLGFPLCISSFFFFSQLLHLHACFGFAFLLHFCRISFLHVQLSLCLSACAACLDRILRLTASRDESAGCTNFPHWTLASSSLCVFAQIAKCICLSNQTYLFSFNVTSKLKKILFSDSGTHIHFFGQCFKNIDSGKLINLNL